VALPEEQVAMLWDLVEEQPDTAIAIDLAAQTVTLPDGQQASFAIDPYRKVCLLQGVDDLGYLLSKEAAIAAFERGQAGDA
jgi:3-isopropylmalate/(R)-2-methylmalate dehydratase small subunit